MKKRLILFALLSLLCVNLSACTKNESKNLTTDNIQNQTEESDNTQKTDTTNEKDNTQKSDTDKAISDNNSSENTSKTEKKNLRIYYYDIDADKIIYTTKETEVKDGALVNAILNCYKGSLDSENYSGLPDSVQVKSAKLENSVLKVNFGEPFINSLGFGSGIEGNILQSLVNSLGYNFNVSKVYITVNGKPYESGHIIAKENEPFSVKYDNCTQK